MIIGKGAGVILINDENEVLLQHRGSNALWHPDCWSFFGGQIEKGETPKQAAKREIKEEIGLELINLRFFKKYDLKREKGIYKAFFFTTDPINVSIKKLKSQQTEGQDLRFFNINEIKELKTTDLAKKAIKDFFEN